MMQLATVDRHTTADTHAWEPPFLSWGTADIETSKPKCHGNLQLTAQADIRDNFD